MTIWRIEPQEPLIVRDGRPFNATPGARARSLPFPFPSTTAGGARTLAGQDENGVFDASENNITAVKNMPVRGPFLIEQDSQGDWKFLIPAPADALLFPEAHDEKRVVCRWLRPLLLDSSALSNKPDEIEYLVGLPLPDPRKPFKDVKYWRWAHFQKWLLNPSDNDTPQSPNELGINGLQADRRVHVAIDPGTFTGRDGALFLTSGRTFWQRDLQTEGLNDTKRLALVIETQDDSYNPNDGFASLGGERRVMFWQKANTTTLPTLPPELLNIQGDSETYCRLVFLTPTYFEKGWHPKGWGGNEDVQIKCQAAIVNSPTVVSGWDYVADGPKESRRLVPAGSVYFLKLTGNQAAIRQWIQSRWLMPLADDEAMAKAGFGITAVGVWHGQPEPIQINSTKGENGT